MNSHAKPELLSEKNSYLSNIIAIIFAIAWLSFPLLSHATAYRVSAVAILIVELLFLFWQWVRWSTLTSISAGYDSRLRRTYNRIVLVEIIGILLVIILCRILGQPSASGSGVAIVVGLHFIPLATVFKVPMYRLTAAMLILAGVVCLVAVVHDPNSLGTRLAISYAGSLILFFTAVVGASKLRH